MATGGKPRKNDAEPIFADARRAAKLLGVSQNTIWTRIRDGTIPHEPIERAGGTIWKVIPLSAIPDLMDGKRQWASKASPDYVDEGRMAEMQGRTKQAVNMRVRAMPRGSYATVACGAEGARVARVFDKWRV